MILGFMERYPGTDKPTDFIEKIGKGIKIHTLRKDENKRWKPGMGIDMAIGVRTKNYFCFNDSHICKSVQRIDIFYDVIKNKLSISVERKKLKPQQITMLIANDGVDCKQDFVNYFFPNGELYWGGRIIHWTDFKY